MILQALSRQASIFPKSHRGFGEVLAFYFGFKNPLRPPGEGGRRPDEGEGT
jgi:hypothetical protein